MSRFAKWPTIKKVYNSIYSQYIYNRKISRTAKTMSQQFYGRVIGTSHEALKMQPVHKMTFEGFQDESCLARWDAASDVDIGGDSKSSVIYNQALQRVILKGKIITQNQNKLQAMPYIGMIQKIPFDLNTGMFNTLRVQIIGDGEPLICELLIDSFTIGLILGRAVIFTTKSEDFLTYELPLGSFQIEKNFVFSPFHSATDKFKTIGHILQTQSSSTKFATINSISFRVSSKKDKSREIQFKKIELVRTMRGNFQNLQRYTKPYFYLVDQNQTTDKLFTKINIGPYQYEIKK